MARPTWQGHLRLSLVTCPVALYKATEPKAGVSFNLINPETKSRIRMVAHDATTGEEVDRKKLVKGYQVNKNQYVLIEPEDLDALKLESTRVLEIEHFVDATAIDRIYWDEPYYLAPNGKTGTEAFAVILAAMREKEKVALGRLVLSQRERIVALEPREERMLVTTLRTHDEIRDADAATGGVKLPKAERQMLEIAEKIIEQQSARFDPSEFTDRYEKAVKDLIRQKMKGKPVATQPRFTEPKVVDLMDMLRKSLNATPGQESGGAKAGRRPRAASKPASRTRRTRRAA
jgi:DNA end-binding protein Ku